jgi:HK97 family phage prohead protease
MPLNRCQDDDKPGWKWGDGKCYTYTAGDESSEMAARKKAMAQAAAMGEFPGTGERGAQSLAPIEFRSANVAGVNFAQRIIDLVVVPYDEAAAIEWRGEMWQESFERGAFDGIEKRPGRVKANRDHDNTRLVGKAVTFWPSREEGLVAEVRISQTPLGEETLALADDDVLGASVGFAARGRDQIIDRQAMTRRIRRAYLDHIALTPDPAYLGAKVQAVRSPLAQSADAALVPLSTPVLDEFLADDILRWASGRFQS